MVVEVLMSAYEACPKCGADCWRESADVGVGIIYGPWGCPECCWSEVGAAVKRLRDDMGGAFVPDVWPVSDDR